MAAGHVTTSGVTETRREVARFSAGLEASLRNVARASAVRVQAGARERLRAQTRGTGATADAITLVEDAEAREFRVEARAPKGKAANLPIWLEHGTIHMSARPFMGPAQDAERPQYAANFRAAVEHAVGEHA